ncbi:3'-5' exonuclease [Pleionea sediminis]|uniref:3'-5' exonuclease n=1 Tax=Pleionea sediminis TaxID=2569479 RepID=UPI0011850031|nr:3'-5' exonuclease [Pleionea sediminis]
MDINNYKNYLIVDLEATCCDIKSIPRQEMETIEIGAVIVDGESLRVIDEFTTFIKPVRHPKLTSFCTELTTIRQVDVDSAPMYAEAISLFKKWLYQYEDFLFCSWGDYDKYQLEQDSSFHNWPFPIGASHLNIKKQFSKSQGLKRKLGMAQALKHTNIELEGTHHRGIDDARNMAKLMPYILGQIHFVARR